MKQLLIIMLLLSLVFDSNLSYAQENIKIPKSNFNKEAKKYLKKGEKYYSLNTIEGYYKSIPLYNKAYETNPEVPALNYKLGASELMAGNKPRALSLLKKAYTQKPDISKDILFLLARAYHLTYKFDSAITYYNKYKNSLTAKQRKKQVYLIDQYITQCNNGKKIMQQKPFGYIKKIDKINTEYPDYSPFITTDGKIMYFTSRRPSLTHKITDPKDGLPYEDIYVTYKTDTGWTQPSVLPSPINTPDHDACVGISIDGQKLYFYYSGDIFVSNKKYRGWSRPKSISSAINSSKLETSATFSFDGNTMYFVRGRKPGDPNSNGDIYVSHKNKHNKWSKPQRLSDKINTPYDEESVFLHPDGKTLYFSSKGHNSMGGFDIFRTTLQDDSTWSEPENLGYPINTPGDDVFFMLEANGKVGFLSSNRDSGQGLTDIYKVIMFNRSQNLIQSNEDQLIAVIAKPVKEAKMDDAIKITLVKGKVVDGITGKPIDAVIEIIDNETNEVIMTVKPDSETGEYIITLPPGKNYGMAIKKDGYLFHSENFDLSENTGYKEVTKDVEMLAVTKDSKIVLRNLFFDSGSADIRKESESELQRIVDLMKQYPTMRVEISGHTDNIGDRKTNMELSIKRAKAVVDYLAQNGIDRSRMNYVGFAYDKPIASNATAEGRAKNRRVEFKILSM